MWDIKASCLRVAALSAFLVSHVVGLPGPVVQFSNNRSSSALLIKPRTPDPTDLSWISRWAAIGDSFTAGIGSGVGIGGWKSSDWDCSRYDYSWPMIVDKSLGPARKDFQFIACSGDRTVNVYDQVGALSGDLNMVMLTAGGNDLCLAGIIKACIFRPSSEADCEALITKAQSNIDNILKDNIRQILRRLDSKMNKDGIVVYNGYAPYFNTDNDDCADSTKYDWQLRFVPSYRNPVPLTKERRGKFNALVANINKAISDTIDGLNKDGTIKYSLIFADWSEFPGEVDGQYCAPGSSGAYPDGNKPDLQFFKRDTRVGTHIDLKRGEMMEAKNNNLTETEEYRQEVERLQREDIYDNLLWKSPNPAADVRHRLNRRDPSAPGCPGDGNSRDGSTVLGKFLGLFGIGLPDSLGKNFHPNERGHETIAAFALASLVYARAQKLGVAKDVCVIADEFTCWQKTGSKAYVSWARLDANYRSFCDEVNGPDNTNGWRFEKTYHKGTPEEHDFVVQLSNRVGSVDKDACKKAFDRVINSCDGNDPENPMNWKFGGRWRSGEYTWEINPKKGREWPMKKPDGHCWGWYKFFFSEYSMEGTGWATWDFGQETLLPAIRGCLGLGVTEWTFDYFDKPEDHGNREWRATWRTPVFVRARCFDNNKVAQAAGGWTNGCEGSDP